MFLNARICKYIHIIHYSFRFSTGFPHRIYFFFTNCANFLRAVIQKIYVRTTKQSPTYVRMLRKSNFCRFEYSPLCAPGLVYDGNTRQHLDRQNSLESVKASTRLNYSNLERHLTQYRHQLFIRLE